MQMRRLVRGRKMRLGAVATALVLLAVLIARYAGEPEDIGSERRVELATHALSEGLSFGFFHLLAFLLPFLFTAHAISEEVEGRTFAYLAARPVGRVALTVGKWAAGTVMAVALLVVAMLILHVGGYATEPTAMVESFGSTLRATGALALLATCYCALCMFWGALAPEAAGIASALYLGVVEFCFSFLPGYFRCASMSYLAQQAAGLEKSGLMPESAPEVSAAIGLPLIVLVTLLFLGFAAIVVQISEYRFSKA